MRRAARLLVAGFMLAMLHAGTAAASVSMVDVRLVFARHKPQLFTAHHTV
jgi:hypothetical protein